MNTSMSLSQSAEPEPLFTIVTQVKSTRVVYFTDDPEYGPPVDGDWYFASTFRGALPADMTLRNCWSWRFNGIRFIKAATAVPVPRTQALLEHNRRALMRILTEKIDELRKPYAAQALMGDEMRRLKLDDAHSYFNETTSQQRFDALEAVAVARNISIAAAADLVRKRAEQAKEMLIATERIRERFSLLIAQANRDDELLRLRAALLQDVYPELSRQFKFVPANTQVRDLCAPLAQHHKVHEISRLKVQLRECVNEARARIDSEYLGHAEILKFKAQIARWVLSPTGDVPRGIDLLENYAHARGLALEAGAKRILVEMAEASNTLLHTERVKDRMSASIENIRTEADIQRIQAELANFQEALSQGRSVETAAAVAFRGAES
ncbi:hypothetical protein [Paraburkholderia caledonica]|uniref:Uncharacterized protein n=1 Tax=Paraburkholderia caledonica TaxID=134536 RepID=A0AB73IPY2_9BURK|nr:hypothetical protein [Paraburkholderia caledonica]